MLELKFEALRLHENEFYYKGELFTGIAFETSRGRISSSLYFLNGRKGGEYRGDYVKALLGVVRLDSDCEGLRGNPEDDETVTLNGEPFDGILYEFENEFCVGESSFIQGRGAGLSVAWHVNGSLKCYDMFKDGVDDSFAWHANSHLREIHTVKVSHVQLTADFSENGHLKHLKVSDNFFTTKRTALNDLPFATISELEDLKRYDVSRVLHLAFPGVTPEVFHALASYDKLAQLEVFYSLYTSLSDVELAQIGELPNIKIILVKDDVGVHAEMLKSLQCRRLNLNITYNGVALE